MQLLRSFRWLLMASLLCLVPASSYAGVFISVGFAPPVLPVYEQPPCPQEGWMWTPGYWAYGDDGYYWVPGTWVPAPYEGALWTPPYWGWSGGLYVFHTGYWGPHVGYYGGVNYGFGYMGIGFIGGRWHDHDFEYNRALCTTESHKIPATIASRCQHFSFRSVDFEDLTARMAWICEQEGIEADAEALAVLAQAGEGSVRDSLSALDQAIACCGAKLVAAEVRALLGAFSLESLEKVTLALAAGDSRSMLEVVDELERNGQNLQHFSRELSRYFRN